MKIPSNSLWTQSNDSDIFGVLGSTESITLDEKGKVRLSKRPVVLKSSADDGDFERTLAIVYFSSAYYAVTTDEIFSFALTGGTFSELANSPSLGLNSDAIVWNNVLYVSDNTGFNTLTTGLTWNLNIEPGALTGTVAHQFCIFDSQTTYKLAITDDDRVQLYNNSTTTPAKASTDLIIPNQYEITTIAYSNGYLYVGTKHKAGGEASIFIWDGNTANANYEITTGSDWVYSLVPYKGSVAAMLSNGQLVAVSGSSLIQLGALPVFYAPHAQWQDNTDDQFQKVFRRGMAVDRDKIYISVTGSVDRGHVPAMKSGIWVYDPKVGDLYHYASLTSDRIVSDSGITATGTTLTTSAAHGLKKGDAVQFNAKDTLTGFNTDFIYYVNPVTTTTLNIAVSRQALLDGNYITFGGTAGGDSLQYCPNTDWGMQGDGNGVLEGHAIGLVSKYGPPVRMWIAPIIFSGRTDTLAGTEQDSLYVLSDSFNIGRFVTQRIFSNSTEEAWQDLRVFLDGIRHDVEEIVVKYKIEEKASKPSLLFKGQWSGTSDISNTNAVDEESDYNDIKIGDEVTIVDGYGRGYTAHVTANTGSVITLDESIGTDSQAVYFTVDNFKKAFTVNENREMPTYAHFTIDQTSAWIIIKVELRGFQTKVSQLYLSNRVSKQ